MTYSRAKDRGKVIIDYIMTLSRAKAQGPDTVTITFRVHGVPIGVPNFNRKSMKLRKKHGKEEMRTVSSPEGIGETP
ncbi:hypothetical protein HAX54_040887, partial [Datura stramonium]|nr:hypothetical protein [Datura stramonium]